MLSRSNRCRADTATARGADNDALRNKFKEGEKLRYVTIDSLGWPEKKPEGFEWVEVYRVWLASAG